MRCSHPCELGSRWAKLRVLTSLGHNNRGVARCKRCKRCCRCNEAQQRLQQKAMRADRAYTAQVCTACPWACVRNSMPKMFLLQLRELATINWNIVLSTSHLCICSLICTALRQACARRTLHSHSSSSCRHNKATSACRQALPVCTL